MTPGLEVVVDTVSTVLNVEKAEITISSGLGVTKGWDSIAHTRIIIELEMVLNITIPFEQLDLLICVESLAQFVDSLEA